ncbi:MAG: hypothetical protein R2932_06485 [Caldilineaceae bacterium]
MAAVEEGFRQLALGTVAMPQRNATPVVGHNGLHLAMPAYVGGDVDALTIKIVTVYGDNLTKYNLPTIQGVLLVHDARTGQVLALMDAEHLTAMRTGRPVVWRQNIWPATAETVTPLVQVRLALANWLRSVPSAPSNALFSSHAVVKRTLTSAGRSPTNSASRCSVREMPSMPSHTPPSSVPQPTAPCRSLMVRGCNLARTSTRWALTHRRCAN